MKHLTQALTSAVVCALLILPHQRSTAQTDGPILSPTFTPTDCWVEAPIAFELTCGTVEVPENRANPVADQPTIQIAVATLHRRGAITEPDPVFFLVGGPGQPAVELLVEVWAEYFNLRAVGLPPEQYPGHHAFMNQYIAAMDVQWSHFQQRDMVLIDQRGNGFSEPSLSCGDDWVEDCHTRLTQAGIDLAAYNTRENAADINAVRLALGYDQINLYGGSYGTELGLVVLRDYGEFVRSAVLEGVLPPSINLYLENLRTYDDVFHVLFDHCRTDPVCNGAYPDLQNVLYGLIDDLNTAPATVEIGQRGTDEHYWDQINGDSLSSFLWSLFYDATALRWLPKLIFDLAAGDATLLNEFLTLYAQDESGLNWGMTLSVFCGEQIALLDEPTILTVLDELPPALQASAITPIHEMASQCAVWGVPAVEPAEKAPVASNVPVLLLSGEFDPVTPPAFAEIAAQTLSHAAHFVMPGSGHTSSVFSPCAQSLMVAFWNDPTAALDATCLAEMPDPAWEVEAVAP